MEIISAAFFLMGSVTMTWSQSYRRNGSDVVKHTFEWESDALGAAAVPSGLPVSGRIERVVFVPSAVTAPTAAYDVTLTDSDGIDVLAGEGANLSETTASHICPGLSITDGTTLGVTPIVVDGILTLNVTNAGNSKAGRVDVYVR